MINFVPFEDPTYRLDLLQLDSEIKKVLQSASRLFKDKGKKKCLDSSHRALTPLETLRKINRQIKRLAGITRIADVTDLDILGIPNYIAVRPNAFFSTPLEGGRVSVFNGKGFTKEQAKASALMEAIERYCAEPFSREPMIASYQEMKRKIATVNPNSLRFDQKIDPIFQKAPIEWSIGIDLFTRKPTAVQAVNVLAPYVAPPGTAVVNPIYSTTGLASGNTRLEATVHALLEVVERHGTSSNLTNAERFSVPIESISNKSILRLIEKIEKHGIKFHINFYKTDLGIPICRVAIDDPITRDPHLLCYGSGCHLSRDVALIRAITEAVQTRVTVIGGIREDLQWSDELRGEPSVYDRLSKVFWSYYEAEKTLSYRELPHVEHVHFQEDLRFILKKLKECGYEQAIWVDLTRHDLNIPVVRVIVPRLPIEHHATHSILENIDDAQK